MGASIRTAIVMSRLPRLVPPDAPWLLGVRAGLRRVRDRGQLLLIGTGTAGCEFVRRGAELLDLNHERVSPSSGSTEPEQCSSLDPTIAIPERDRTLAAAADELLVLGLRSNGHWHRLLRDRLRTGAGGVTLVDLPNLEGATVRDELASLGAAVWKPTSVETGPLSSVPVRVATLSEDILELVPFLAADGWVSLSHTTRGCPGPWPEQSPEDYLDSLLLSRSDADHSPVGTLERILQQQRLIASARTAREGVRVVSFTASPLSLLPELRRFRPHRSRWDFEPFGLCLRRSWLEERGARPVIYGDEVTWRDLNTNDRPFFQLAQSQPRAPAEAAAEEQMPAHIDWTIEREWRHIGDLDLSQLPRECGLIFVPNYATARRIATVSSWPITLWPDPAVEVGKESRVGSGQ